MKREREQKVPEEGQRAGYCNERVVDSCGYSSERETENADG